MADTNEANYWPFYLMGRDEKLLRIKADLESEVEKLRAPSDLRPKLLDVASRACDAYYGTPIESSRKRRQWLEANADAITAAGGDKDAAFAAWRQGRIDEVAYAIEGQAMEALHDLYGDDEEDPDDEGDGEEGDD